MCSAYPPREYRHVYVRNGESVLYRHLHWTIILFSVTRYCHRAVLFSGGARGHQPRGIRPLAAKSRRQPLRLQVRASSRLDHRRSINPARAVLLSAAELCRLRTPRSGVSQAQCNRRLDTRSGAVQSVHVFLKSTGYAGRHIYLLNSRICAGVCKCVY